VSARPAVVRFYVDADILGLGKLIAGLRYDVTYPGDPGAEIRKHRREPCPVTSTGVLDPDWIPVVAARGWLIITRDSKIITNRNEINAVREHGAKMVALNQQDAATKWGQLEVFMARWRDIEKLHSEPGAVHLASLSQHFDRDSARLASSPGDPGRFASAYHPGPCHTSGSALPHGQRGQRSALSSSPRRPSHSSSPPCSSPAPTGFVMTSSARKTGNTMPSCAAKPTRNGNAACAPNNANSKTLKRRPAGLLYGRWAAARAAAFALAASLQPDT
jgi:PIN like domain